MSDRVRWCHLDLLLETSGSSKISIKEGKISDDGKNIVFGLKRDGTG
jgi:hypothetical protein